MEMALQKRKWSVSAALALAGIVLLCFLMGSASPVLASDADDEDTAVEMTAENNYGADVLLPVDVMRQNPELPNGCEITALTMLLRQRGYDVDKLTMADKYLPRQLFTKEETAGGEEPKEIGGDPEKVYCGDPAEKEDGFYCFQGPIIEAANAYLADEGSPLTAVDMSGAPESALVGMLDQGTPVMIWCTLKMDDLRRSTKKSWTISETGEEYVPYSNLHSMVLVGYNDYYFYLNDPLQGLVTCPRYMVMNAFNQLGSRAVILL